MIAASNVIASVGNEKFIWLSDELLLPLDHKVFFNEKFNCTCKIFQTR